MISKSLRRYIRQYRKDPLYQPLDGGWGWIVCAATAFSQTSHAYAIIAFVLLYSDKLNEMEATTTSIAMVVTVFTSMQCVSGLIAGPMIKNVSYQCAAMLGSVLAFLGYAGTVFAQETWHLACTYGFLAGTGSGLIVASNFVVVNVYFKEKRAWAVGLQMTGGSMAQMIMPQVIAVLLEHNGYVGSVLFVGAYMLNSGVAALLYDPLCKHSKPRPDILENVEEMQPLSEKRNNRTIDEITNKENRGGKTMIMKIKEFFDLDLLGDPIFLNIVFAVAMSFGCNGTSVMMIPLYLFKTLGLDAKDVALCITIRAVGDVTSRAAITWVLNKFKFRARNVFATAVLFLGIFRSIMVEQTDLVALCVCLFIEGLFRGIQWVYINLCFSERYCLQKLPNAIGLSMFFRIIGTWIVGPVTGTIRDVTGNYSTAFHVMNAMLVFPLIFWCLEYFILRFNGTRGKHRNSEIEKVEKS